jgi:hypothetical protein
MPRTPKTSSSRRRRIRLQLLCIGELAMWPCRNRSRHGKPCRVAESSEKCVECVHSSRPCDLAPLNTSQWKQSEEQRKKLKAELHEAYTRQQRLLRQIDFLEEEQQVMVGSELENIKELEKEESIIVPDPLVDVASEQIAWPTGPECWSFTSLASFEGTAEVTGNSFQGS